MPHQCTKCSKIYPDAAEELLKGCSCGARFFYYIKQEKLDSIESEMKKVMTELDKADKEQIEQDIREITGLSDKPLEPVILDLESVRVLQPGKFEIDIVNLFSKNRPLIYKLEEGKYIIDLASSLDTNLKDDTNNKITEKIDPIKELEKFQDKEKERENKGLDNKGYDVENQKVEDKNSERSFNPSDLEDINKNKKNNKIEFK